MLANGQISQSVEHGSTTEQPLDRIPSNVLAKRWDIRANVPCERRRLYDRCGGSDDSEAKPVLWADGTDKYSTAILQQR